ncbi:light harvesting complex protein [Tribonema minus]|uniref:Light harvesting complex protein n=1 Tax=Tribonema minus TaxID=303371 RepID=A0A835Z6T4_9STRA|nr:light harvesting complex protein [Tribonema minus]
MMKAAAVLALAGGAAAFMPATPLAGAVKSSSTMSMVASKSLPFLPKPEKLDGSLPGDVGFDPLNLSATDELGLDLYWFREAEVKHGRIAMLAVAGVLFCDQVGSLPGFPSGKDQMDLFWQVFAEKPNVVGAGVVAVSILEFISGIAITAGRKDGSREAGDFNLDPFNVRADPAKKATAQLQEIKNGRLAMLASMGMIAQGMTTHEGALDNISAIWN